MYHEKEKAATGLEPVTAKPFLPNPYLAYFDKLELNKIAARWPTKAVAQRFWRVSQSLCKPPN